MYKNILLAIDLNDETSCRKPLLAAVELVRTFGARLHVVIVVREVEAILQTKTAPLGYELIAADLENRIADLIRRVNASELKPNILVTLARAFMRRFWGLPRKRRPISLSSDHIGRP
jgi:hypothetical protein